MDVDLEKLKEEHKDVFENPDVTAIANWYSNPPILGDPSKKEMTEEQYVENARRNMKGLRKYLNHCIN